MPKVYCVYQKNYLSNYDRGHVCMISSGSRGDPKDLKYSSMTMTQASCLGPNALCFTVLCSPIRVKVIALPIFIFFQIINFYKEGTLAKTLHCFFLSSQPHKHRN